MKPYDIKVEQRPSTETTKESWSVTWTKTTKAMKNERWIQVFESLDEAVDFIRRGFKD